MAKPRRRRRVRRRRGDRALSALFGALGQGGMQALLGGGGMGGGGGGIDMSQYGALMPQDPMAGVSQILGMGGGGAAGFQNEASMGGVPSGGASAGAAIMDAARQAAGVLSGVAPAVGGYYQTAIGREGATDAGLYNQLMGSGAAIGGNIAQQLAAADQNVQPGFNVGQIGAGSAGAMAGQGAASMSQLLGEQAAAQSWAAGLPGIAMQQGAADAATAAMAAQQQAAEQAQSMREQQMQYSQNQQQMMLDAMNQGQEREFQKALARLQFAGDLQKQAAEAQGAQADRALRKWLAKLDVTAGAQHDIRTIAAAAATREDEQAARAAENAADRALRRWEHTHPQATGGAGGLDRSDVNDLRGYASDLYTSGATKVIRDPITKEVKKTVKTKLAPDRAFRKLMNRAGALFPNLNKARRTDLVMMAMRYAGYTWTRPKARRHVTPGTRGQA